MSACDECVPLNAFYEAVLLTDATFRILHCNDRAVQLFRATTPAALIGRLATDFPTDHDTSGEFPTDLRERLTAVPFVIIESHITRDDGTTFMAETIAHRIDDNRFLLKVRDVTARTENLHRLEAANERLRASDRFRMEFVSNVSHDLRTPLTSMSYALTNLLRGICGTLPPRAIEYLERLQVDIRRLQTTVNDLLDLRQIESGTLTLHKTHLPVYRLLTESTQSLRVQAEAKHQTLTLTPHIGEAYTLADRHKLERVFFNVLSNAVKYTPEYGAITATLTTTPDAITVQIDDTGIGIPPEALPRVTQRYFRVGDHVTGTGLGLSIVRELIELHDGTLHITSPVPGTEKGTRVTLTLPRTPGPLAVIISGDETFIHALSTQLTTLGNTLHIDRNATAIARDTHGLNPAHFLLDGTLPQDCLNDLIYQIRSTPHLAPTPILILGGDPLPPDALPLNTRTLPYPLPLDTLRNKLVISN